MTAAIAISVAAVVASFVAGWLARGWADGRGGAAVIAPGRGSDERTAIDAGRGALEEAQFAMEVALRGQGRGLDRELEALYEAQTALSIALGPAHPLTRDLSSAREALQLIAADLQARGGQAAAIASVVRDARARYRHSANAIAALP